MASRLARTVTIEVGGLLSVLSARGVEKQLARLPGVYHADVNYVGGSATVVYDESVIDIKTIKEWVRDCGYHCAGEMLPKHVCAPEDPAAAAGEIAFAPSVHAGHVHEDDAARAGQAMPAEHAAPAGKADAMAHEMGHGAGMDMQAMVRDMRNRFFIALVFTVPIFVYSPMGGMFTPPAPPFSLPLNAWLFLLASMAVLYPVWPFATAAWRAMKNGVLNMAVLVMLSVGTGYLFSVGATFFFEGVQFYEAVAVLLVFILLGHWLEMRARAAEAIRVLMGLVPPMATVIRAGREVELATAEVMQGDAVLIRPCNKIRWTAKCWRASRRWTNPCLPASPCR